MAEITKQALKVDNNTSFPNNNNGAITPSILRAFNVNMIDSMVDEIGYNVDSASWNVSIDNIEAFTASLSTAFVTTGSFNTYTASTNTSITNLNASSASQQVSINNINAFTASQQSFNASATASIVELLNLSSSLSGGFVTEGELAAATASLITQINTKLNTSSFNAYTSSNDSKVNSLIAATGSYATTGSNQFNGNQVITGSMTSSLDIRVAGVPMGFGKSTGTSSIAIGVSTLLNNTGNSVIAIGTRALQGNTSGGGNTAIGLDALQQNTTGQRNIGIGEAAGRDNQTGQQNTFIGNNAGYNAGNVSNNTLIGYLAAQAVKSSNNTVVGDTAALNISSGSNNTIVGQAAGVDIGSGSNNVFIGQNAGRKISGSNNTFIGLYQGIGNESGVIALSDGSQNVRAIYNSGWVLTGSVDIQNTLTASLAQGFTYVGNASGRTVAVSTSSFTSTINTGSFATTASFNSYTSSNDQRVSSLENATSSLFTSASLGITTASVSGVNLTFTKGDGTQFTLQTATGSVVSASYAETASLAINAKDIVVDVKNTTGGTLTKGTVVRIIGAIGDNALIGTASWEDDNNSANTLGFVVTDILNDSFGRVMTQGTLLSVNTDPALGYAAGDLVYLSSSGQFTNVVPPAPYHEVRLGQVLRAQQNAGSVYVLIQNGYELTELHDVDINTGSLANNNLLAYNSASQQWENKTLTEVGATTSASFNSYTSSTNTRLTNIESATASLFTSASLALVTASFSGNTLTFTKGDASTFGVVIPDISGSTIDTGSFATTGSNTFTGDQTLIDAGGNTITLSDTSGSLMMVAKGFTSASAHLSSSAANKVNIIFKNNDNTTTTYISGSNNIFTNSQAATAGFRKQLGSSNINIFNVLPEVSASMGDYVAIDNNFITSRTANPMSIRGPISSSQWEVRGNTLLSSVSIGTSATNNAEKIVSGLLFNQNQVGAAVSVIANRNTHTQQSFMTGNSFLGSITLNMASSSIDYTNNINIGGAVVVRSESSGSASTNLNNTIYVNSNLIGGNTTIVVSGSDDPNDAADTDYLGSVVRSVIYGSGINVKVNTGVTGSNTLAGTAIIGNSLTVSGSSRNPVTNAGTNLGSAFFGRFNALDGNKALTAQTIFAVGTGTGTAAASRKTGFLIDSGSNTFIEGSLTITGSEFVNAVNITGSVDISGSTTIRGNLTQTTGSITTFGNYIAINGIFTSSVDGGLYIDNVGYVGSGSAGAFFINSTTQDIKIQNYFSSSVDGKNIVIENFSQTGSAGIHGKVALRARGTGGAVTVENTSQFRVECQSEFTGSVYGNVVALSITSNTASMDLNLGNYFTLTLADTTTTHISASNVHPGTSATLVITTGTNSSASLAPTMLQPSGSAYSATNGSAKKDVLSIVAVASGVPFVVSTKNMI